MGVMNLLIDGCPLQTPARDRGIGRYTSSLLAGLKSLRPNWQIKVIEHSRLDPIPSRLIHHLPIERFTAPLPYALGVESNRRANDLYYGDWVSAQRPDHVLLTSVFERLGVVPKFIGARPRMSAVLYDLIPVLFPEHYDMRLPKEKWYARRVRDIAAVDTLFAISEAAAQDTRRLIGSDGLRVVNIQGAVDPQLVPVPAEQLEVQEPRVRGRFNIDGQFVLYVGGYDHRKNLVGALQGFAALPEKLRDSHTLVIACYLPDELATWVQMKASALGVGDRIVLTGYVSDEDLIVLYQSCRVFFFPSLYEGLGLPVLEALRCGALVVCSNSSSLPEYAGEDSWLCDPTSAESMAEALCKALAEPAAQRRANRVRFAESFSWEKVAGAVISDFELEVGPRRSSSRLHLAWVAATATSADLASLAAKCDVELVLPDHDVPSGIASRFRLLSPDEIIDRDEADPFDLFVVCVNADGPDQFYSAIGSRHRGLVILDDPDPCGFMSQTCWKLILRAGGVVVRSPAVRQWVRSLSDTPVVTIPYGPGSSELLIAAIKDTLSRLAKLDSRWVDAIANSLADIPGEVPSQLITDWATLRSEARKPRPEIRLRSHP